MRVGLRWKILSFTVVPLVGVVLGALWMVNRDVSRQVHGNLREDLKRASAVLENLLDSRSREILIAGQVIAQDPRFFSVLTIPGSERDPQLQETVSGVARDFNRMAQADVFEVFGPTGARVASVGRDGTHAAGRDALVAEALAGRTVSRILVESGAHYQATIIPVIAGRRVIGALLLGLRIGPELADRLRQLTRSEVTFASGQVITASTLESVPAREATRKLSAELDLRANVDGGSQTVLEVRGGDEHYLTLVRRLPLAEPEQRQCYVMQRSLDAETLFLRGIQARLGDLGLIAFVAALVIGILIASRITSPVQRLVRGAEEMERGNYDYPLGVHERDEIGRLAERFEVMRERQRDHVKKLEETARLKSEFISVASHELRTPITVIRGFHELMAQEAMGALSSGQKRAVEAIGQSLGTLERIAENATRMSQIEEDRLTLHRDSHEVQEIVNEAITGALVQAERRQVRVTHRVAPDIGTISVDGPRLTQALTHLITNGIRFTPDHGSVEVRAARETTGLSIEVRDTGVGIEKEKLEHIFERSFIVRGSRNHHSSNRLEFNSAGLGLGLSIARGIVVAHGGALAVESVAGHGSTFTIRLPEGAVVDRAKAA
jgi:signal transduction histidine kinase